MVLYEVKGCDLNYDISRPDKGHISYRVTKAPFEVDTVSLREEMKLPISSVFCYLWFAGSGFVFNLRPVF